MKEKHHKPVAAIAVKALSNCLIEVSFDDGCTKVVDLKPFLDKPIAEPLKKPEYFAQVKIDSFGGIYWPNTYDICPDFLRYYA
ncbi:MAG: DUF2442 domain-containing protein [Bacteroidetes bacterium]|nr:DUF2442 domain-containing protein [Bacteroidota bacterium]MBU1718576.1 DUF2442 domain-containing protein [Bacteroidota bacterium]